ncbi:hepatocellular carcinoma-associated antigen 59-domain-containing protein [Xylariomycetidae sp. FL2044]|nr:hepatocellular carcinoma-associated antigen 59-domain-containing protein [Xylariomycetidae sp. FL2044]
MDAAEPPVVFRGKKRKTYRQRGDAENDTTEVDKRDLEPSTSVVSPTPGLASANDLENDDDDDDDKNATEQGLSVAEVLRLRNARKARLRGGVRFGPGDEKGQSGAAAADYEGANMDELSLMIREEENRALDASSAVDAATKRFAPQTGLSVDLVNKHMEEYIEAELARRHNAGSATSGSGGSGSSAAAARGIQQQKRNPNALVTPSFIDRKPPEKHNALLGKLMEVDLGEEMRSRNAVLTERATRKLQGEAVEDDEPTSSSRPRKVRLGRDGKPWRPRNRRNSDDIKRDQLVEQILRENKLDNYEIPIAPGGAGSGAASAAAGAAGAGGDAEDDGAAADDKIAEAFRRDFMDALEQRRRRRRPATNAPPRKPDQKAKKDVEILRGPKLGGSRNERAAMRDLLLQKEREKAAANGGKVVARGRGRRR